MNKSKVPDIHRPLEEGQIRLAKLQPSLSSKDPIVCHLEYRQLSLDSLTPEGLSYEGLSYQWGDLTVKRPCISLEGKEFPVTPNLFHALTALRRKCPPPNSSSGAGVDSGNPDKTDAAYVRVLWVDALCINQSDTIERSSQIKLMRSIYAFASNTIFWLGGYDAEDPNLVNQAFAVVEAHANKDKVAIVPPDPDLEVRTCLSRLGWRAWFRRAWVVQEVFTAMSCSHQRPVLMCGDSTVSFRPFVDLLANLAMNNTVLAVHCLPALTMRSNLSQCHGLSTRPLVRGLYVALGSCYMLEATDVRDKIYAWLGIILDTRRKELDLDLVEDYDKPAHEVLLAYGTYLLRETQDLNLLAGVGRPIDGLPSWVPTWDTHILGWHPRDDRLGPCVQIVEGGRKIKVEGFKLFEIKEMAVAKVENPLGAESREQACDIIKDLEKELLSGEVPDGITLVGEDMETKRKAWARMCINIVFGCEDVSHIIDEQEAYMLFTGRRAWEDINLGAREMLEARWAQTKLNITESTEKKMALLGTGLLGIAYCVYIPDGSNDPRLPKEGDAVFRIRGTALEILLTPVEMIGKDVKEWKVVGLLWKSYCTAENMYICPPDEEVEFWDMHKDRIDSIVIG